MRIIVEHEVEYDKFELLGVKNLEEYYNKFYNKDGILFDKNAEAIYYDAEVPFIPMEGQIVITKFGICIVTYSCLDLCNDSEHFYERSRIVVSEE